MTPCVICGERECPPDCRAQEWPPRLTKRLLLTRVLITLALFLSTLAMIVPKQGLALGLALSGLATMLVVALLTVAER